jgi:hypothetical protein
MKSLSPAALAALEAGTAIVTGALEIGCTPPLRVWGGYYPIIFEGRTFELIGDRGLVQVAGGALGDAAQNISLALSGIEPEALELLDAEGVAGAPAVLWRLIFDQTGNTLLGHNVWARGRLDTLQTEEEIGGTAAIVAQLETAAKGLGRSGARMRSDADQRLINPSDGFFKNVSFAAEKTLYWGGRRPARAGAALPGVGGGFGSDIINAAIQASQR